MQCLEWNPEIPSWDNYYLNLPRGPRLGTNPISWDITPRGISNVLPAITSTRTTFSFCSSSLLALPITKGSAWLWPMDGAFCTNLGAWFLPEILPQMSEQENIQIPSRTGSLNSPEKRRNDLSCSYHHISAACIRHASLKERIFMIHLVTQLMMGMMGTGRNSPLFSGRRWLVTRKGDCCSLILLDKVFLDKDLKVAA